MELHLDEFMGGQGAVDFLKHGCRQPILAYADDGMQMVRGGAQSAALGGGWFDHGDALYLE